jgi:hypothetical protein
MNHFWLRISAAMLTVFILGNGWAEVIYVDGSASGANNGSSWSAAYSDLQVALAVAEWGDEIWIAAGTYKPTSGTDQSISFVMTAGVGIYGGFSGAETTRDQRDWTANETILSGDIGAVDVNTDNSRHVVVGSNDAMLDASLRSTSGRRERRDHSDIG